MEPVSHVAGGFRSTFAGLRNQLDTKKKRMNSVYSYSAFYKKPRNPKVSISVVDLSAGLLGLANIGNIDSKFSKSWGSKMESKVSSIGGLSDLENMKNTVTEKTSYADSDNFVINNMEDDITPRKMHTRTYVLGLSPKTLSFDILSSNKDMVALPPPKFKSSNQLPSIKSHVLDKRNFEPVKSFALDIELSAVPEKSKALVEFESSEVASSVASKWSVLMKKNSMDQHRALLYTLPVDTTAHDLSGLLDSYDKKICFIGCNLSSYVYNRCGVICFADETFKLTAIKSVPVFKGTSLRWAGLSLACCAKCKQFGHISDVCLSGGISEICGKQVVTDQDRVCLAGIYKKKHAPIAHLVSFSGKTWVQVAGGFFSHVAFLVSFNATPSFAVENSLFALALPGTQDLYGHLVSLKCSLELLANQVSGILVKLGSLGLVSLAAASGVSSPEVPMTVAPGLDLNMVLDGESTVSTPSPLVVNNTATTISPSSSKVLTTKVGSLESKMMALEVLVESVLEKLDYLCSDLGLSAAFTSQ
ncbi:hypothetical protein G9A89_012119 [Geosiphon pyriformis]|nr:hypothetical protein G9A89_012119 [Geosiphon pyriformis]